MQDTIDNARDRHAVVHATKRRVKLVKQLKELGGLTPALRWAHFCDAYGVRTAWHGPGDLSPVGAVAQLHLDLVLPNFGIQEYSDFSPEERRVFKGCPTAENGFIYVNDAPGWGIDLDETEAAKYPPSLKDNDWLKCRLPDGTCIRA